jgi:hypothetical protein
MKSVYNLIVPFILGIENVGEQGSPFKGIVFFKDSNVQTPPNLHFTCLFAIVVTLI